MAAGRRFTGAVTRLTGRDYLHARHELQDMLRKLAASNNGGIHVGVEVPGGDEGDTTVINVGESLAMTFLHMGA